MSHETTALPVCADGSDQELLESVIEFYKHRFKDEPSGSQFLISRGLASGELLDAFEIGYADRELGRTLPPSRKKEGRELRERIKALGIYRNSGHGHFNGSLVIPIRDAAGLVVNVYGRKTTPNLKDTTQLHTWLAEPHGVFNREAFGACDEIILTDSIVNALSFWNAEMRNVSCTFGMTTMHDCLIEAFKKANVKRVYLAQRNTPVGDHAAAGVADVLAAMNIETLRVKFGADHDANDYLLAESPDRLQTLVKTAQPFEVPTPSAPIASQPPATEQLKEEVKPEVAKEPTPEAKIEAEVTETDVKFTFDDRHYRVRGFEKNHSLGRLKINLLVERKELIHVDTLDLYSAQARTRFIKHAAAELYTDELAVKYDLSKILRDLETLQEEQLRQKLQVHDDKPKQLTEEEQREALVFLRDPKLLDRILTDYDRCGLVGEETNKLVCYLGCVSRLLDRPLAIMIQSSSAAGKTTLMDAALAFVPPEHQIRYSAMTGQSLYYMGQKNMCHKILAVAEEEGVAQASYALKLLQSDGKLKIACAGKNSETGRNQTDTFEVEGPVMMFLTTTAERPDMELLNRSLILRVNESAQQTAAIHARQAARYTLAGQARQADREAICLLHQNAQRLLKPLKVIIPWADQFTFRRDQTRMRRDFDKYLSLIATITLLHQYQREQDGDSVIATLEDVETANRLASEVLGQSLDDLMPQTRQLLVLIDNTITERTKQEKVPRLDLRFTQRELREATGWNDRSLRRHLARLVELEYVLVYRTGQGNQRHYQLLYDGQGRDGKRFMLGLMDTKSFNRPALNKTKDKRTGTQPAPIRRPLGTDPAGSQTAVNMNDQNGLHQTTDKPSQNEQEGHAPRKAS